MIAISKSGAVIAVSVALALVGCESMNQPGYGYDQTLAYRQSSYSRDNYSMYGTVQSIELVRQDRAGSTIGLGTIAGAAGGAYVGHELENRNQQQADAYRVTVRMEDGSNQTLMQNTSDDIRVGDRVRIENGVARRY
ncbi:MAG: hypothetical protein IPP03_03005 [Dechloromonas sp.]|jgi:outer membrane lipoprotein SlyB|nr:hypothetical protein [Candidatus Dechloromonas phosphoritropha]